MANSSWRAEQLGTMLAEDEHFEVVETRLASALKDEVFGPAVDVVVIAGADDRRLRLEHPCIVVLAEVSPGEANIEAAVGGQVRARLPIHSTAAQISAAIIAAAQEFYVLSRDQIQGNMSGSGASVNAQPISERLTGREKQVLRMMADGLGNKQIAQALGVSDHTAKFHVSQVLGKLGTSTRAEAVRIGIRRGLVPI